MTAIIITFGITAIAAFVAIVIALTKISANTRRGEEYFAQQIMESTRARNKAQKLSAEYKTFRRN